MLPFPRGWDAAQLTQDQDLPAVRLVDHRRGNPAASRGQAQQPLPFLISQVMPIQAIVHPP
jgi:hypothetical protein